MKSNSRRGEQIGLQLFSILVLARWARCALCGLACASLSPQAQCLRLSSTARLLKMPCLFMLRSCVSWLLMSSCGCPYSFVRVRAEVTESLCDAVLANCGNNGQVGLRLLTCALFLPARVNVSASFAASLFTRMPCALACLSCMSHWPCRNLQPGVPLLSLPGRPRWRCCHCALTPDLTLCYATHGQVLTGIMVSCSALVAALHLQVGREVGTQENSHFVPALLLTVDNALVIRPLPASRLASCCTAALP